MVQVLKVCQNWWSPMRKDLQNFIRIYTYALESIWNYKESVENFFWMDLDCKSGWWIQKIEFRIFTECIRNEFWKQNVFEIFTELIFGIGMYSEFWTWANFVRMEERNVSRIFTELILESECNQNFELRQNFGNEGGMLPGFLQN